MATTKKKTSKKKTSKKKTSKKRVSKKTSKKASRPTGTPSLSALRDYIEKTTGKKPVW